MGSSESLKEWKIRQILSHQLEGDRPDDLNQVDIEYRPDTVYQDSLDYVRTEGMGWVYPAKSYIVGIAYAYWLSLDFGEDMYEVLDDPDLLFNNDPYFIRYTEDKELYDSLIKELGLPFPNTGVVPHIRSYYLKEFMLDIEKQP